MTPTSENPRLLPKRLSLLLTALAVSGGAAPAASNSWIAGTSGNYSDAINWTGGVNVPNGAADNASSDGAGSVIHFLSTDTVTLNALNLNQTSGATVFNQSGGSLTLTTLGFGGGGGSRNPTYNLSGGTVSMSFFTWGNGSNARFNVTGGGATYSGSAITIGVAGGANGAITVSSGSFSHTGTGQIQLGTTSGGTGGILMTGGTFSTNSAGLRIGTGNGTGNITLSGGAIFNANGTGTTNIYLGNNGGSGNLTLSDTAQFNSSGYVLSVGQFGNTTGNKGTLTMSGTSTLSANRIVLGGDNSASAMIGIVNLNGGTVSTGSIRLGSSTVAASATANVINANGGTLKAVSHATNSNFLQGAFVNLQAGGLKLDTNGNEVTITNAMSGSGGLTKQGSGTLTLTGSNSYAGATAVESGTLHLGAGAALAGAVTIDDGATLSGIGTIGGSTTIAGTHAVGASPGLQTFSSGLEYLSTGVVAWELVANTTADRGLATGYDAIDVSGGAVIVNSGATINLVFNAAGSTVDFNDGFWASDQSWRVIDVSGSATDGGGDFSLGSVSLDANALSSAGFGSFAMSKTDGDHYLVWTAVPEPGAALIGSLGLLGLLRRRRR
ncbi:autotransporter-associated beta strand repeat-containing protein [Luteolibacter arcticus]|uniref:Autotransporter-associated beta strand repeat-containing protein n=1 Tax=Luteolibacter arcticus TaxID=1581411 RepID=A0ABT3GJE3_9BACT|nr:autotransporter-associated beta strand repeat-containing protein [Luteolibacter arcticus]MCW1923643.1 autotransporter-associated beta strand repeat-containing protein [Luteolibacter arcticus]